MTAIGKIEINSEAIYACASQEAIKRYLHTGYMYHDCFFFCDIRIFPYLSQDIAVCSYSVRHLIKSSVYNEGKKLGKETCQILFLFFSTEAQTELLCQDRKRRS